MPFATTAASLRRLPLFFAYCPDRAGALQKRLEVRPAHWERWAKDREEGHGEFGMGFLPPPGTPLPAGVAAGSPNMAGSLMLFRAENLESAWSRIKGDVYWTEGVWDPETCVVREFLRHELYNDEEGK